MFKKKNLYPLDKTCFEKSKVPSRPTYCECFSVDFHLTKLTTLLLRQYFGAGVDEGSRVPQPSLPCVLPCELCYKEKLILFHSGAAFILLVVLLFWKGVGVGVGQCL